jgi:hypothetical protein
MTHKHEWRFMPDEPNVMCEHYYCNCGKRMFILESEQRLNATEHLSAEDAVEIKYGLYEAGMPMGAKEEIILDNYAKALRGEE